MNKNTICLWFDHDAERFFLIVFLALLTARRLIFPVARLVMFWLWNSLFAG
ncbi:MAG: hypothetical protein FD128_1953 [Hyphomonadaceae bacterium]|nr:MAG: hypothetical protein FD128_1953 [Hyphomonadaceae bacterium]